MINIYKIASILLLPVILPFMLYRLLIGKEQFSLRFFERFGIPTKPRFKSEVIWFHCASVGESNAIFPLIEKMEEQFSEQKFLITTGTKTSAKLVTKRLVNRDNITHQFIPIDSYFFVKLFLIYWRPSLALFVESEIWPCLITEAAKSANIILLNARISDKSVKNWLGKKSLLKPIRESINLVISQSNIDVKRFESLGFKNLIKLDNLKYSAKRIPMNGEVFAKLALELGARNKLLAASTSEGEEEILIKTYTEILQKTPNLLLTITPRHPSRSNEIANLCKKAGLNFAIRSKKQKVTSETNIYIADTLGELGSFYRLHDIAFIGGSLNKRGGQNPIEPANLKCAIIVGENVKNFAEIYEEFTDKNAVLTASSQDELREQMLKLLGNQKIRKILIKNSKRIVEAKQNIVEQYIEVLSPYINKQSL